MTDAERLERIKRLGVSDEEAQEILAYDKEIDKMKDKDVVNDLTPEQIKIARVYKRTGTAQSNGPRNRTQKADPTKEGVVSALAEFLQNDIPIDSITDVEITNKTREILFKIAGEYYSIVMTRKTKMNKK